MINRRSERSPAAWRRPTRKRLHSTAMKHSIPLLLLIVLPLTAVAQPAANPDLTLRARAVLQKHCGECHGLGQSQLGELSVAARSAMDLPNRADRPFLRRGNPDGSQLIDL